MTDFQEQMLSLLAELQQAERESEGQASSRHRQLLMKVAPLFESAEFLDAMGSETRNPALDQDTRKAAVFALRGLRQKPKKGRPRSTLAALGRLSPDSRSALWSVAQRSLAPAAVGIEFGPSLVAGSARTWTLRLNRDETVAAFRELARVDSDPDGDGEHLGDALAAIEVLFRDSELANAWTTSLRDLAEANMTRESSLALNALRSIQAELAHPGNRRRIDRIVGSIDATERSALWNSTLAALSAANPLTTSLASLPAPVATPPPTPSPPDLDTAQIAQTLSALVERMEARLVKTHPSSDDLRLAISDIQQRVRRLEGEFGSPVEAVRWGGGRSSHLRCLGPSTFYRMNVFGTNE